ncbi:NYN domain-containing protein [Paracidovorax anthurii]|uniref:Uncharacterized protein n=1 Tax=Paracidovorax anthurii TaxID=78229 RepID=A0A328YJN0_9BURK|nr:hypothetical protein AX018_10632 [Paracidovorax anthurii]
MKTVWIVDGAYLFNYGKGKPFDYLKGFVAQISSKTA